MKKWPDLLCAIAVWDKDNWVSTDEPEYVIFSDKNLVTDNLERIHYRKELIKNLTEDAKYLLTVILDTPDDFAGCICGNDGVPKKTRVVAFLNVSGWKYRKINSVFKEISKFIKEYYGG